MKPWESQKQEPSFVQVLGYIERHDYEPAKEVLSHIVKISTDRDILAAAQILNTHIWGQKLEQDVMEFKNTTKEYTRTKLDKLFKQEVK